MRTTLFFHSEIADPFPLYEERLLQTPVYKDILQDIVAVHSYAGCKSILDNPAAQIPPPDQEGLNEPALAILGRLARTSNPPRHQLLRETALKLAEFRKPADTTLLLRHLLKTQTAAKTAGTTVEWVSVCKQLPPLLLLKSWDFSEEDSTYITRNMPLLVKILSPDRTDKQTSSLCRLSNHIYTLVEKHIRRSGWLTALKGAPEENETMACYISNLIGWVIQSYDACRGLLTNVLHRYLLDPSACEEQLRDQSSVRNFVLEVLRFDPPVHNTRRVAATDIILGKFRIAKGDRILVVLAAALRDEKRFGNPQAFDIHRANLEDLVSFGHGPHQCIGSHLAVDMAIDVLQYMRSRYPGMQLTTQLPEYEPLLNVRLLKELTIRL